MKLAKYIGLPLILLLTAILLAAVFFGERLLKGYINRYLTDIGGRELTIAGDLEIDLG
jgi:uncharacterized protein involved in outer membrane biogenesis